MNKLKLILVGSLIISQPIGISCVQAGGAPPLLTAQQKLGYALGMEMGKSLKKMHPDIEIEALLSGIHDTYLGKKILLREPEAQKIRSNFRKRRLKQNKIIQADKRMLDKEAKKTIREQAKDKPAYSLDFSMIDQSTPRNTAWSFVILYNDIMPVFTDIHLDKICRLMSTSQFMSECHSLLQNRLEFLKKDPALIKRAIFTNPKVSTDKIKTNSYDLSWIETFTSPDGDKTVNHKKISIQLSKGKKWRIKAAHFIK